MKNSVQYLYAVKALYQKTFFALLLSIILLLNSCGTTETETGGCHNKILFTSSRSGKNQLYMMNPDGTNITQITSGEYSHSNGRWSPDASKIVCNTEEGSSTSGNRMVLMSIDGTDRKLLREGNNMSWSPDGKKIAFSFIPSAELGGRSSYIYVFDIDSNKSTQITKLLGAFDDQPHWTSNSAKIFFTSNRHGLDNILNVDIYSMNIDGSDITRLTYTSNGSSYSPSISHSGDKMVLMCRESGEQKGSIYISSIAASDKILLLSPPENEIYNYPCWSSDDQSIAFLSVLKNDSENISVYKIGIDGKNLVKLSGDASLPDWSK